MVWFSTGNLKLQTEDVCWTEVWYIVCKLQSSTLAQFHGQLCTVILLSVDNCFSCKVGMVEHHNFYRQQLSFGHVVPTDGYRYCAAYTLQTTCMQCIVEKLPSHFGTESCRSPKNPNSGSGQHFPLTMCCHTYAPSSVRVFFPGFPRSLESHEI